MFRHLHKFYFNINFSSNTYTHTHTLDLSPIITVGTLSTLKDNTLSEKSEYPSYHIKKNTFFISITQD